MASQSQKPVRVGFVGQQQQQPEQPGRTPSPEKSSPSHLFAGWHEGSLSLPSESGLRPPHPPSPQPSPKTQLASINPFESRRPLRLGEYPQGALRPSTAAPADDGFFTLPKNDNSDEYALTSTPTIELHPAQHNPSSINAVPTPTSSSSDKWSSSEASSYAHVLQRERVTKKNFKKVMVAPPHLSLPNSSRPAPPRNIVSSPAIVMQPAPPSPGFQPPLKSMTFSDAFDKPRSVSPHRREAADPHISLYTSKIKARRAKASIEPEHAVSTPNQKLSTSSPSRGHHRSIASGAPGTRITTQSKPSDSILRRGVRERPVYPGNTTSFVSTVGSIAESVKRESEGASAPLPPEEAAKQGFLRVLTVHSIVPAPIKREATKLLNSESPYRRQSKQSSVMSMSRSPSPGSRCFGLLHRVSRRRRNTHASIQTASTSKAVASKRKDSYVGADGREYIHRPVPGLSFLPSEMQRVNTPPVGRGTQSSHSRSRGFFFDYTNPPGTGEEVGTRRDSVAGSTQLRRKPSSP